MEPAKKAGWRKARAGCTPIALDLARVPRLHDSAGSELERRLHSNILGEGFTNCANASRWPATRHHFLADRAEHERAMAAIRLKYWMFRPIIALGRVLTVMGLMRDNTGSFEVTLAD